MTNALRLNLCKLYDGGRGPQEETKKRQTQEDSLEKTIHVEGMMCGHCENAVKTALEKLEGVASAEADHEKGIARVVLRKCPTPYSRRPLKTKDIK